VYNKYKSVVKRVLHPYILKKLLRFYQGELTGRIARGSFWTLTSSVLTKFLMLFLSVVIARILGKFHFGELGIVQSTVSMFGVIAGFGLGVTSTKYVAEYRDENPIKAGAIIASSNIIAGIIGFVVTLIFIILAPSIAISALKSPSLVSEIRLASIILFFSAINGAQIGALVGFEDFKSIAKVNVLSCIIYLPIQVVFTYIWGLKGAIFGLGINYFIQWILYYITLRKTASNFNIRIKITKTISGLSYLWRFSLPALLGVIVISSVIWYCNTMMVSRSNGFNEMAIYSAATQWQNVVLFIPMAISQISLPLFSNSMKDKGKFIKLFRITIIMNLIFGLTLAIVFTLFSRLIMAGYGLNFIDGSNVLILLCFAAVLNSINSIVGQIIVSLGKMWLGFILNLIFASIYLFFATRFLSQGLGAVGLAKSYLFAYIFHTIVVSIVSYLLLRKTTINNTLILESFHT
jgi:O-antigen/teichoic acid export membrane protein